MADDFATARVSEELDQNIAAVYYFSEVRADSRRLVQCQRNSQKKK
jgi:hypothetical protein